MADKPKKNGKHFSDGTVRKIYRTRPVQFYFKRSEYTINDEFIDKLRSAKWFEINKARRPNDTWDVHVKRQVFTQDTTADGIILNVGAEHYTSLKMRELSDILADLGIRQKLGQSNQQSKTTKRDEKSAEVMAKCAADPQTLPVDVLLKHYNETYPAQTQQAPQVPPRPTSPTPSQGSSSGMSEPQISENLAKHVTEGPKSFAERKIEQFNARKHAESNTVEPPIVDNASVSEKPIVVNPVVVNPVVAKPIVVNPREVVKASLRDEIDRTRELDKKISDFERSVLEERKMLAEIASSNEMRARKYERLKKMKAANKNRRKSLKFKDIDTDNDEDNELDDAELSDDVWSNLRNFGYIAGGFAVLVVTSVVMRGQGQNRPNSQVPSVQAQRYGDINQLG